MFLSLRCFYFSAYKDPTTLVNDNPIEYCQDDCLVLLANFLNAFLLELNKLMDRQNKLSNIVDSIPKLKKDEEVAMILDDTIKTDDKQGMATKIEYNKRNIQNVPLEKISTGTKNSKSSFSPQTFPKSRIINTNSLVLDFLRRSAFHRANLKSSIPIQKSKPHSIINPKIPRIITAPCNIKKDNTKTHSELMLTSLKKQLNVTRRNNSIIKEPNNNFTLSNETENKLKYPMSNGTNRHVEDKTNAHGIYSNYQTKQATSAKFKKNSEKYIKEYRNKHFIRSLRMKTCYMKTKASVRRNQNNIQGSYKTDNKTKKNRAITRISCTRKFNKKKYEISNNKNRCRDEYYRNNAKCDIGDSFKSRQTVSAIIDPSLDFKETEKVLALKERASNRANLLLHLIHHKNVDLKVNEIEWLRSHSEISAQCLDLRVDSNISTNSPQSKKVNIPMNSPDTKLLNSSNKPNVSAKNSNTKNNLTEFKKSRFDCFPSTNLMNIKQNSMPTPNSRYDLKSCTKKSNANVNMRKKLKSTTKIKQSGHDTNQEVANGMISKNLRNDKKGVSNQNRQ